MATQISSCSIVLNISNRRRSPPELSSHHTHGSSFTSSHSGRTVLPPLSSGFAYQDSNIDHPPSRMSPSRNEVYSSSYASNWPPTGHPMAGHQYTYPPPFEMAADTRFNPQAAQSQYQMRASPGIPGNPDTLRRVPPISIPQHHPRESDFWAGDPGHVNPYPASFSLHAISDPEPIHSPSSSYPMNYDTSFHSMHQSGAYQAPYSSSMESRHLPHPHPMHYQPDPHPPPHRTPHPGEWAPPPRGGDGHLVSPYARNARDMMSHSPQESTPPDFPVVKKKRKRADAAQLKILNEVYARTAFPTTEERLELSKKLDMSARSVQIWFQNKRQSTRQNRTQVNALPPIMHHPYQASSASTHMPEVGRGGEMAVSPTSAGASYGSRSPGRSSQGGVRESSPRPSQIPDPYRRGRSPEDASRMRRPAY